MSSIPSAWIKFPGLCCASRLNGRSGINVEGYEDFIQTDASINPGNSGGALVDLDGGLVGINTAIVSPAGGNVGIGFAVPALMARAVIEQLVEHGEVRRGQLGVVIQDVTPALAEALALDVMEGALVTQVQPDSAAEEAGLETGDVIIEFDGSPVVSSADLRNAVGLAPAGASVEIVYLRDGERRLVMAAIEAPSAVSVAGGLATMDRLAGAEFGNIDPTHPRFGDVEGVLVRRVEPRSPAARGGLRAGDIVMAVNRSQVTSIEELSQALEDVGESPIALNVLREGSRLYVVIE